MSSTKTEELMRAIGDCTEEMQLVAEYMHWKRMSGMSHRPPFADWYRIRQNQPHLIGSEPPFNVPYWFYVRIEFDASGAKAYPERDHYEAAIIEESALGDHPPPKLLEVVGSSPNDALEKLADAFQKEIQEAQAHVN